LRRTTRPTYGARLAEARVWNIFNSVSKGAFAQYLDYAQGYNLKNRMPLFCAVPEDSKLSVNDTMYHMRTHFEGTWFDNEGVVKDDIGAGSGNSPYRWRPLEWKYDGKGYVNERTVGVQQTAWTFVAVSRSWMPDALRGLFWFAPDDSSTAVRAPFYPAITKIPASFGDPIGQEPAAGVPYAVKADAYNMNMDSAFWVWNLVANMAYGERYNAVYPQIQLKINEIQGRLFDEAAAMDKQAAAMMPSDPAAAIAMMTNFSVTTGDNLVAEWRTFWMFLFSRFRDGFTTTTTTSKPVCTEGQTKDCTFRLIPDCQETGYSDTWYNRIVTENGAKYAVPPAANANDEAHKAWKMLRMQKKRA